MERAVRFRVGGVEAVQRQAISSEDTFRDVRREINCGNKARELLEWRFEGKKVPDDVKVMESGFDLKTSVFDLVSVDKSSPEFVRTCTIRLRHRDKVGMTNSFLAIEAYVDETLEDVWKTLEQWKCVGCDKAIVIDGRKHRLDPRALLWDVDLSNVCQVFLSGARLQPRVKVVREAEKDNACDSKDIGEELKGNLAKLWEISELEHQAVDRLVQKTGFPSDYVVQVFHLCGRDETGTEECLMSIAKE